MPEPRGASQVLSPSSRPSSCAWHAKPWPAVSRWRPWQDRWECLGRLSTGPWRRERRRREECLVTDHEFEPEEAIEGKDADQIDLDEWVLDEPEDR